MMLSIYHMPGELFLFTFLMILWLFLSCLTCLLRYKLATTEFCCAFLCYTMTINDPRILKANRYCKYKSEPPHLLAIKTEDDEIKKQHWSDKAV